MHILLIVAGSVLGIAAQETTGLVFGGLLGYLLAEVLSLRKRLADLERRQAPAPAANVEEDVVFFPVAEDVPSQFEDAGRPVHPAVVADHSRIFSRLEETGAALKSLLVQFFTGGNPVLKGGILVIFFGVAFLLKYAAQRNLVPIEFRLAAAAIGGMILLGVGWKLRHRAFGYGLGLQGGGVGILYLVVYAAAKLYQFLPLSLSLALMVGIVIFSGILAVLQDAKYLAVFGIVGGFLSPVLMSTGSGSHVVLFSYYAVLNCGILGISWYKSWRELNLLGFFFTFGVASLWGGMAYQPEYFATTEPFLALFFLFYLVISVLFAHRQPVNLRGFIDGPLVFGLPLIVSGLQYALVRDFHYGMAFSALALGLIYTGLAILLWKRLVDGMRMLAEAFLALGVVFGSLAIPLAFDGQWTTAAWALEGAAMIWVGVRQRRILARIFALILQAGAAVIFSDSVWYPSGALAFANSHFLGCAFIALSALFSSFYLDRNRENLRKWECHLVIPLMAWGLLWWYCGGLRESDRNFVVLSVRDIFLLFGCASTILMAIIAAKLPWLRLLIAQLVLLPILIISGLIGILTLPSGSHLFSGWGWLAWLVALFTQYRLLYDADQIWPKIWAGYWHVITLWLALFLLCHEAVWLIGRIPGLASTWSGLCWGALPAAALLVLIRWGQLPVWPIGRFTEYYFGVGMSVPAIVLFGWGVYSLQMTGDSAPLKYIPIFNPLELALALVIVCLCRWALACRRGVCSLIPGIPENVPFWLIAGLIFLELNSVVGRTVHFYGDIPYTLYSLWHSVVFQAAIAALWGAGALAITVWSAHSGNRRIWCVGAALLAMVVVKLFVIDLSGTGTVARIVSFLVVGGLMLIIGYFSPLPPQKKEEEKG